MVAIDIREALQGQPPGARALRQLGPAPNMFAFVRHG